MLTQAEVTGLVHDQLFPAFKSERARLDVIDLWYRWQHVDPQLPPKANVLPGSTPSAGSWPCGTSIANR